MGLHRIHGEAIAVRPGAEGLGFRVELAEGKMFLADQVVLAFGFLGPQPLPWAQALAGSPNYIENPWNFRAMDAIAPERPVAIIGTGHTAIDALFRLTTWMTAARYICCHAMDCCPKRIVRCRKRPCQRAFHAIWKTCRALLWRSCGRFVARSSAGSIWDKIGGMYSMSYDRIPGPSGNGGPSLSVVGSWRGFGRGGTFIATGWRSPPLRA